MTRARFILDIAFDLSVGIMMLGVVVGAIAVSITPASPQTLSSATTTPSVTEETPEKGSQDVVLVPVNPTSSYISIISEPLPSQAATAVATTSPSRIPSEYAALPPSTPTVAVMQTTDYIYVFAIVTAVAVVFNLINYAISLVYRLGIPTPKY